MDEFASFTVCRLFDELALGNYAERAFNYVGCPNDSLGRLPKATST